MIDILKLQPTYFDGCALGLRSAHRDRENLFIKKPWTVFHNTEGFYSVFAKFLCPGVSRIHEHEPCRGVNAKKSERYTDVFAVNVHRVIQRELQNR